jgi:FkbM family methyltransferase
LRIARGVFRSLRIYYSGRARRQEMQRFYAQFVRPGDLAFDIGAHVGDRIAAFRALGARVIAVEPQPALVMTLRLLYGRDRAVTIEPVAVADKEGSVQLHVNLDNPTVSTASAAFAAAAAHAPGWEGQVWSKSIDVPVTTLDTLIARHGAPRFIKIDVEGFEAQALAGLTTPSPALSFEFTTIQRDVALACLTHCETLGYSRFNAVVGESHAFAWPVWQSSADVRSWLLSLPDTANSGDIYARLA